MWKLALISWILFIAIFVFVKLYIAMCSPTHKLKMAVGNTSTLEALIGFIMLLTFIIAVVFSVWAGLDFVLRL